MMRRRSVLVALALASAMLLMPPGAVRAQSTPGAAGGTSSPPVPILVDAAWLAQRLEDPALRVVALTPRAEYDRAHIPGAVQMDWPDLAVTDTSDPAIERWQREVEQKLGALGLTPDQTVVIYDGGTLYAPRLWWVLDQLGHARKSMLDGGLAAWQAAGYPTTAEPAAVAATEYRGTPNRGALASLEEVKAALGDPGVALVDARRADEYTAGHIPGAVSIDFERNARAEAPRTWLAADDLRALYAGAGVTPEKRVIAYCLTGVRSAVTYFTLKLLGYEEVQLYTGSWAEWSVHPELPRALGS